MEGEFQVGEKCIAADEPGIMAVEVANMTDQEICQMTKATPNQNQTPILQQKFNPNPCFQCRLPGHKAAECMYAPKDKVPEVGGKIHHFMETQTPVDKNLSAEFFNKYIKVQAVKKFRRYQKKFQEAVTAAQTMGVGISAAPVTAQTPVTAQIPTRTQAVPKVGGKRVTFSQLVTK